MKITLNELVVPALLAILLVGCSNTGEGIAKDAEADSKMSAKSASDAMEGATKVSQNMTAAVSLTPAVKLAFAGNSILNNPNNRIDVDSDEHKVTLSGTVQSEDDKALAEKLAAQILKDHKARQELVNNLTVQAPKAGAGS